MSKEINAAPTLTNTLVFALPSISEENDAILHGMMRRQRSAVRVAYNQFREGETSEAVYAHLRRLFPEMDSYEVCSIRVEGAQTLASQKALQPTYQAYLQKLLQKLEKKQNRKPDENRAERIKKTKQKLEEITNHIQNGTVEPAVFGGKKLWKTVERGVPEAKEAWRAARSNQYFLSGDKSVVTGNQHFGLEVISDRQAVLSVRITGINYWLKLTAEYSKNQQKLAQTFALPYHRKAVRLIRLAPGKYQVNVTADELVTGRELFGKEPINGAVICGIDLNLDHLTTAITDPRGQFKAYQTFQHPNLGELPKNKSQQQIFRLAKQVVAWCKEQSVAAMVLEDLKIEQTPEQNATQNRRTVTFSYRQLHDAIVRHAQRQGINIKQINPAYTSWIGELKYQDTFGISRHIAAAYVIARRGLGKKEALPKRFLAVLPKLAEEYEAKNAKARAEKTKERYTTRIKTLREWKQNSPKTSKHAWKLWAVLLNYWNENQSNARASHTNGRNYLVSLRSSGGNTPPVSRLKTPAKASDQDLSGSPRTTQGMTAVMGGTPVPHAAVGDGDSLYP